MAKKKQSTRKKQTRRAAALPATDGVTDLILPGGTGFHEDQRYRVYCPVGEITTVDSIKPHPQNPHRHPPEQLEVLVHLIRVHGWRHPIDVSLRTGFIIGGHLRLDAAKELGLSHVPVARQAVASDEQEIELLLADDMSQQLSYYDTGAVADLIVAADEANQNLLNMALTPQQIAQYIHRADERTLRPPDDEDKAGRRTLVACPECGHEFQP